MLIHVLKQALMITAFVFIMMLVIEYLNVQTRGNWQKVLLKRKWTQYVFGALLGAIPGCLGAFVIVTLYSHRIISLGALVAAMIATSGDESFVMLAMFPGKAILLTVILFIVAILAGIITDLVLGEKRSKVFECKGFSLHEEYCECFPRGEIVRQLRKCSLQRFLLMTFMVLAIITVGSGVIGPEKWNWIRSTLFIVSSVGLFIVATVPEHFLEEHLWNHVAKKHVPNIFLWTFGALLVMAILIEHFNLESWIQQSQFLILVIACLVGLIPESGPHMIFVTLFAQGMIPFSILAASSIVQDGHGMLPLLAHSRKAFIVVKIINLIFGLAVGLVGLLVRL